MVESRCGLLCSECSFREATGCKGCANMDKPFWLIAARLNPVVKLNLKIIVENVMILFVLYFIPLPMTWNKAIMG